MTILRLASTSAARALRELCEVLAQGPVSCIAEGLVVAPAALAPITDEFAPTSLLVRPSADGDVRVRHHQVMSVGTGHHEVSAPDHRSVGALAIAAVDAEAAMAALARMAELLEAGRIQTAPDRVVELAAAALVRSGIGVRAIEMVDVPWYRSEAVSARDRAAAEGVPESRIRQLQANRLDDGLYSTFVLRRLSKPLTRAALRLGLSPNLITVVSFAIGLLAALSFAAGSRWALMLGAVLLQASIVIDCVDGEVARATRRFTVLGAWLDASTDRVKEMAAYAGLAVGAAWSGAWWIAIALVVLQTARHMSDYDFSRVQRMREAAPPILPLEQPSDGGAGGSGWSGAVEASARMNRRAAVRWVKRAMHMPIGERWLVLSLGAAILGPSWALGLLLVLVVIAAAYVTAGRAVRTLTWSGPTPEPGVLLLARQADATLLGAALRSRRLWQARAAWAVPAALRLAELGAAAIIVRLDAPAAAALGFLWLAIVAFHHYDVLYRALAGAAVPRWLTWLGLGWDGRTIVLLLAAAAAVLSPVLLIGSAVLAVILVLVASAQWLARAQ